MKADLHSINCTDLITNIYDCIERNRSNAEPKERIPSKENWRFTRRQDRSPQNKSPEVNLERDIVGNAPSANTDWANQIPVASGLLRSNSDKGRHVDLAHKKGEREYELIELKVEANNLFYAAMEIFCYGLLYIHARAHRLDPGKSPLLNAETIQTIHLRVWAPPAFYDPDTTTLCHLEAGLSDALAKFAESKIRIHMDFRYRKFPKNAYEAHKCAALPEHIPELVDVEAIC